MTQAIIDLRKQLDEVLMQLDNYYVQIKLHHERAEFGKAFDIYKNISPLLQRSIQLQNKIDLYRTAENLNRKGILTRTVKRVNEATMAMD